MLTGDRDVAGWSSLTTGQRANRSPREEDGQSQDGKSDFESENNEQEEEAYVR